MSNDYIVTDPAGNRLGTARGDLASLMALAARLHAGGRRAELPIYQAGARWGAIRPDGDSWRIEGDDGTIVTPGCIII